MAQVSYGTITVSDLTDITDVYLQYCMAADTYTTAAAIEAKTTWITPEVNWFTLSNDTTVNSNKIYYELDNNIYFIVHPSGSENPKSNNWYEDSVYPTWQSGYQIWVRQVTIKEGINQPEYGTPYLDKAVNQINNNFINLDNRLRNFFYPGDPSYSGAFAVSKSTADGLDVTDADTYGFNTRMGVGSISMGYNKIPLLEMGILGSNFNGIKLYSPIMDHSTISGNRLDATLTSEGLKLLKGGIEAGTYNSTTTDFIYLSTIDYNNTPTVNIGGNTSGWRQIIGSKFGVKNDGTLYAAGAHVDGDIIAQSLTISNGSNTYDAINAMNSSTYAIAITNDPSNTSIVDPNTTTYLYPILYHGGVRIEPYVLSQDTTIISGKKYYSRSGNTYTEISSPTGNPSENGYYEIDYTHFIWYQDDDTIGTVGSAIDGGIIASYGHTYRVIFNLSDEEVGAVPTVQQLMVDPSKYITRTSDTGVTIHPEVQTSTTILQLNDDGLDIVRNGASIAKYGVSARVGADNSSRFLINSASLQAYNDNNQKYFEVSGTGINWGTGTTSTTLQLDNEGFEIVRNGVSTAKYGNTARIGSESSSRFLINGGTLQAYDSNNNKYFEVNENGLSWGVNTAATTTEVNTLNNYIHTHLTVDNEGVWISPDVGDNKVLIATGQGSNYKTAGTYIVDSSTSLASFTTNGVRIGKSYGAYLRLGGQELEFHGIMGDDGEGAKAKLRFTSDDGDFPAETYIEASEQTGISYRAGKHIFFSKTSGAVLLPGTHIGTELRTGENLEYYTYIMGSDDESIESKIFSIDWNGNLKISGDIYPQNTKMVDFIVKQSTSGIWTYRKWNSGIAELWGTTATANYNITTQYGGSYYTTVNVSVLTGIFTSINSVSVNRANGGQGTIWCSPYGTYSNIMNGTLNMYVSNGTSYSSAPISFSIEIKGRWK